MVAYDGIGVFNLTVFEIVAFTLVFAWLIALVAITHASPRAGGCREPAATSSAVARPTAPRGTGGAAHPAVGAGRSSNVRPDASRTRRPRRASRTAAFHDVRRALRRGGDGTDDPPDALAPS